MIWVAVKAAQALSSAEREILIGVTLLGIALMFVAARVDKAPIFQLKRETATTVEATVQLGTD